MIASFKWLSSIRFSTSRYIVLYVIFLLEAGCAYSQYTVKIKLVEFPADHQADSIFVAGNFNQWNPSSYHVKLSRGKTGIIELTDVPSGKFQYKFTRGSWDKAEGDALHSDIPNREFELTSDTVIEVAIAAWKDDAPKVQRRHTSSANVKVIDTAFNIPQLNRKRRIWIYLPPGYEKATNRYPVIYMQDGQNLFDAFTASFGEWGVDESVDSLVKLKKPAAIIVGIDNGPDRMTEYNPYQFKDFGKGEGDEYVDFLALTLKPYIDKHYRTLPSKLNTVVAGSSMGGLISYYAMLKYPELFGNGGIFSPSFWTASQVKELTHESGKTLNGKLFFYMGGQEGDAYLDDMKIVTETLGETSSALIYVVIDPDARHNEAAWRKWFPEFYKWTLADGFNNIVKVED